MLSADDLLAWFQRLDFAPETRAVVGDIRSANPTRRVGGGKSNVSGRYPSRKMGVSIQFESHRVELAGIYEMEHDVGVLEYFDQPPSIKLEYQSPGGKQMGVLHTPDFFVIREREAGWEEWKTEEELERLLHRNANRYCKNQNGAWHCPPGTAFAQRLGLYYRVRSSAEINWVFQRNVQFLEDYLRDDSREVPAEHREKAIACVSAAPGLPLEALLQMTKDRLPTDEILALIASDVLRIDWSAAPLAEPGRVKVFSNDVEFERIKIPHPAIQQIRRTSSVQCGSQIIWDEHLWSIVNVGKAYVGLLSADQKLIEIPIPAFEKLVDEGRLEIIPSVANPADISSTQSCLSRASETDLKIATHRSAFITRYLRDATLPSSSEVPERTFFRWLAEYRKAESIYGSGFLGLLPRFSGRGNHRSKLPELSLRLMREHIERDYETLKQKTKYSSWIQLQLVCSAQGTPTPSYKTFCLAVEQRPAFEQRLKRQGRRASYQAESFYWTLELTTPRHGDRPFEIAHLDHTELDVECLTVTGQLLGRPWMTLMTDAYSRRTLGFYLTFDPPSYRSCMMVLRECVRRFNRLPQILVVDGGREFDSTYFETLLARYECTKKTRPPAKARFGSIIERMFGVTNTQFIHNLRGNTQIMRNVRQVTKSVNPKQLATWTLPELHERLEEYFFEVHDTLKHQTLGQSPHDAFQAGLVRSGVRGHKAISYDQEFLMHTLPTTAKGTARVLPSRGIKIHHIYYWCEAFRRIKRDVVPVRYDPFDVGIAYAYVEKRWLQCHSDCYGTLKGRSEREIMLATAELHKKYRNHSASFYLTARRLAEFLQSVEGEEILLTQRLRDGENRAIHLNSPPFTDERTDADRRDLSSQPVLHMLPPSNEDSVGEIYGEL